MGASKGGFILLLTVLSAALFRFTTAADPDPLVDFVPVDALGDAQFKFALGKTTGIVGPGGMIQPATIVQFPALA